MSSCKNSRGLRENFIVQEMVLRKQKTNRFVYIYYKKPVVNETFDGGKQNFTANRRAFALGLTRFRHSVTNNFCHFAKNSKMKNSFQFAFSTLANDCRYINVFSVILVKSPMPIQNRIKYLLGVKSFITEVLIIQKPVHRFALHVIKS